MLRRFKRALLLAIVSHPVFAQTSTPAPSSTPLDFSGLMFGAYSVRVDSASRDSLGGKNPNRFSIDRVYLNFRMPAGDNAVIRVTTDIFQNTNTAANGYYQGWAVRL